jgi:hypothetical protein
MLARVPAGELLVQWRRRLWSAANRAPAASLGFISCQHFFLQDWALPNSCTGW